MRVYVVPLKSFIYKNFIGGTVASLKSKAQKNKLESKGGGVEYRCLVRATDGKKTISTSVCFQFLFLFLFMCLFIAYVVSVLLKKCLFSYVRFDD